MVYGGGERNEKMEWENKNNSDAFVKVPPESALVHNYYILTTYLLHVRSLRLILHTCIHMHVYLFQLSSPEGRLIISATKLQPSLLQTRSHCVDGKPFLRR